LERIGDDAPAGATKTPALTVTVAQRALTVGEIRRCKLRILQLNQLLKRPHRRDLARLVDERQMVLARLRQGACV
jgi:hypothetical protein